MKLNNGIKVNCIDVPNIFNVISRTKYLHGDGIDVIAGYLDPQQETFKHTLTEAVVQDLHHNKYKVLSIWERGEPTSIGYFTPFNSIVDQSRIYTSCKRIGQPAETLVFLTFDFDSGPNDYEHIHDYVTGIRTYLRSQTTVYHLGAYGNGYTINRLFDDGLISARWLSESTGFLDYDPVLAEIVQYTENPFSFDCDTNAINCDISKVAW